MDTLTSAPGAVPLLELNESSDVDRTALIARFTSAVGGEGGTIADAAVRRAAATSMQRLLDTHPEVLAPGDRGWSGDLLCLLYQWFFADTVAEFLRIVIAEKVKLVVPVLPLADPEDHIADWVAERVLRLLPNPCEEAAELAETAEAAEAAEAATEGVASDEEGLAVGTLAAVARGLVPRAADSALGLLAKTDSALSSEAPSREEPAA
ncbi:hypothetical protein [Streptomyces sp. NPDC002851]